MRNQMGNMGGMGEEGPGMMPGHPMGMMMVLPRCCCRPQSHVASKLGV